jgi:hypothetical protein
VALLSVYTRYVTMDFERRRLMGSEVLYGIVYQSGEIRAITRSGSTRWKGNGLIHALLASSAIHFMPIQHTLKFLQDVL